MNYNTNFNTTPYYPYNVQQTYNQQTQSQVNDGTLMAIPVQGESGARLYPVGAGNTVLLVDFNEGKLWIKSTNVNGIPQKLRSFTFTEDQQQESIQNNVTRDEFTTLSQNVSSLTESVNKLLNELGGDSSE